MFEKKDVLRPSAVLKGQIIKTKFSRCLTKPRPNHNSLSGATMTVSFRSGQISPRSFFHFNQHHTTLGFYDSALIYCVFPLVSCAPVSKGRIQNPD